MEKIKAAAAEISPDERMELLHWWVESPDFKQRQLAALKSAITRGIDDLENGRFQTHDATGAMQLSAPIGNYGRNRPNSISRTPQLFLASRGL